MTPQENIADGAREGTHKVALGIGDENVAVTRYLTIVIGTEEDVAAAAEAAASFGEPIEIVVEPPPDEGAGEPIEIVVEPPGGDAGVP